MSEEEVVVSTGDTILDSWTIALQTTWIAPVTVTLVVMIFAHAALPDTLRVIKVEVGVAGKALIFGRPVATLAVFVAALASRSIRPESNRALRDALSLIRIIEGKQVKLWIAGQAVVKVGASGALRVALSAGTTGKVSKVTHRAG